MTQNKRFTYLVFVAVLLAMFIAVFFSINLTTTHAEETYTITWYANGNVIHTSEVAENEVPVYDGPTSVPAAVEGYHQNIEGWQTEIVAATEDASYNATLSTMIPDEDTPYRVHVYKQQATGNGYDEEYVNKTGTTGSTAEVTDTFEHFTLDSTNVKNVLSGDIEGDGSLVLVAYYNRETFNVTWKNWNNSTLGEVETYRYGATPAYSGDTPTKPDGTGCTYSFTGWNPTISVVEDDAIYTAQFQKNLNNYTVAFAAGTGCSLVIEKNGVAISSGANVTVEDTLVITYSLDDGYLENSVQILPDGVFDKSGNILTNIRGSLVISATATPNPETPYTVKVYAQNINNDEYSEYETINSTGTTDTKATYEPPVRTGFTYIAHQNEVLEANINGDGSTILKVYYERNIYEVTWKNWDNSLLKETPDVLRYGATPSFGSTPEKNINGYTSTFTGWSPNIDAVSTDVTYTAQYQDDIINYTLTITADYGVNITVMNGENEMQDGDKYTIEDTLTISYSNIDGYSITSCTIYPENSEKYSYNADSKVITGAYTDIEIVIEAEANTDTLYTVYIFTQNIDDDNYTAMEPIERHGTTDVEADISSEAITGFQLNTTHEGTKLKGNIDGDGSLKLYAYFDRDLHVITWMNGSVILETDEDVKYGATPVYDGNEPTKQKRGYTYAFIGWEPQVGEVVEDRIYRAQFSETVNEYTITIPSAPGFTLLVKNANQESVVDGAKVTIEDELSIIKSITPGFSADGDIAISSANSDFVYDALQGLLTEINEDVEIIFSATPNDYTITFNQDDIEPMQTTAHVVTFGTIDTLELPLKIGYDFVGWYNGEDQFTDKDGLMLSEYIIVGDVELVAHFAESKYIITYDSYFEGETKEVDYNELFALKVPSRAGHVFDGWYYGQDQLTDATGASIGVYSYPQDIEIESHWIKITIDMNLARVVLEDNKDAVNLHITVYPEGSSTYTFSSSNEDAFIVDQDGKVQCIANGRAMIRATLDDGQDYVECEFISVDKIYTNDECILYIDINEGVDLNQFAILCAPTDKLSYIAAYIKGLYNIQNTHILRTDIGVELDESLTIAQANLNDGDTLVINLFYNVTKATNTVVNYKIANPHVEYGKPCYIEDIRAKEGYKHGKLVAKSENSAPVTVYQDGYYLIMVNSNVVTDVLITEIDNIKTNIKGMTFEAKDGWDPTVNVAVTAIALDAYDRNISIPEDRQVIYAIYVEFTRGDEKLANIEQEYTLKLPILDEFKNQEQIRIRYQENGETKTRTINIKDGKVEITLKGDGDFVFISNILESTVYLYWLIVLLLFLDAFLGMIVIIMVVNYQDALQRRRDINGYSTILPVVLLSAVIAGELAFVVFLGIVFVAEIIAIAWLGLKLTNKYFLYTTYNKLSYNPYRVQHETEKKNEENNSNDE